MFDKENGMISPRETVTFSFIFKLWTIRELIMVKTQGRVNQVHTSDYSFISIDNPFQVQVFYNQLILKLESEPLERFESI